MIKIAWYDIQTDTDCISPTEWNNMVTYIQHSACTDFTIYSTCPSTGQVFRFTQNVDGITSELYGGSNSGDIAKIFANDTDARPNISMTGNGAVVIDSGSDITFREVGADRMLINAATDNIHINGYLNSAHFDVALLGDGVLCMKETATPTADTDYGKMYCKNDNKIYFQDGAGVEHEIAFV